MKTGRKTAILGCLAAGAGAVACWRWMIRMPLKEFTRYTLHWNGINVRKYLICSIKATNETSLLSFAANCIS